MAEQNPKPENAGKFQPWLEKFYPRQAAVSYLNKRGSGADAEDICQQVSQKLAKHKNKKKIETAYVWISLRNMANDYHRRKQARINKAQRYEQKRQKKKQKHPLQNVIQNTDKSPQEGGLYDRVRKLIDGLDLKERTILKLRTHKIHKFTFSQIADIIGYSESSVRITYHRIEKDIKKLLYERQRI